MGLEHAVAGMQYLLQNTTMRPLRLVRDQPTSGWQGCAISQVFAHTGSMYTDIIQSRNGEHTDMFDVIDAIGDTATVPSNKREVQRAAQDVISAWDYTPEVRNDFIDRVNPIIQEWLVPAVPAISATEEVLLHA